MIADTPTLGLLIGLPVGIIFMLLGVAVTILAIVWHRRADSYDRGPLKLMAWGGAAAVLVAFGITAFTMWPWKHDYHFWVSKSGVVQQVSKRLVPAGDKSMEQKYVFKIGGQPYGVLDTRAALVKPGDRVNIACKKAFEWGVPQSSNGWDCKWRGMAGASG